MAVNFTPPIQPDVNSAATINWLPFGIKKNYYSGLSLASHSHNGLSDLHFYYNPHNDDSSNDIELRWALLPNGQGGANYVIAFPGRKLPPGSR